MLSASSSDSSLSECWGDEEVESGTEAGEPDMCMPSSEELRL